MFGDKGDEILIKLLHKAQDKAHALYDRNKKLESAIKEAIDDCNVGYEKAAAAIRDVDWLDDDIVDRYETVIFDLRAALEKGGTDE